MHTYIRIGRIRMKYICIHTYMLSLSLSLSLSHTHTHIYRPHREVEHAGQVTDALSRSLALSLALPRARELALLLSLARALYLVM